MDAEPCNGTLLGLKTSAGLAGLAFISLGFWMCVWALVIPVVWGWDAVVISSGSMEPTLSVGDVVLVAPIDTADVGAGRIISFDDPSRDDPVTHRVVAQNVDGSFSSRGDANGRIDSTSVQPGQIRGAGRLLVPFIGAPHLWAANGDWLPLLAFVAIIMVAVWMSRWAFAPRPLVPTPAGITERLPGWIDVGVVLAPRRQYSVFRRISPLAATGVAVATVVLVSALSVSTSEAAFNDSTDSSANALSAGTWPEYDDMIIATSGLVSYWRLGLTTTATVAPDDHGSSDGAVNADVTTQVAGAISGDEDTATSFDGTSSRIDVGNDVSLQLGAGSIEAWLKTAGPGDSYRSVVAKSNAWYILFLDGVIGTFDEDTEVFRSSGMSIDDDLWHHVVLTFQSGVSDGTKLYVDGVLKLTTTITVFNQDSPVWIGAWAGDEEYFTGEIDEVAIYDALLTPATIVDHYQDGSGS